MKIALIGYGKMGREIESVALGRGHEIVLKVNSQNPNFSIDELRKAEVAIEFSKPDFVIGNIKSCFNAGVPVVIGTTGWYNHYEQIKKICWDNNQCMLAATNFSIGVNIFFELSKRLAEMMNDHWEYDVIIDEIHHTQKLDAPSGTAITIAEGIMEKLERKDKWVNEKDNVDNHLNIFSHRIDNIPGTHVVKYTSPIDDIEIKHTAHNRKGFAMGAVVAAEWIAGKKGVFTMKDVLKL
ncbi:MAG: 4-hydroxy-tetrahydrodipicolinate reductase [Bacteroidota bacterium]